MVRWRTLAAALAAAIVLGAAAPPLQARETGQYTALLLELGVVRGDAGGLALGRTITRAELVALTVRFMGREEEVLAAGSQAHFADTAGHWAEPYIAFAARRGLVRGVGADTFAPDAPVTAAQALTLILRLVHMAPAPGRWPAGELARAVQLGIVDAGSSLVTAPHRPVTRGELFEVFGRAAATVPLPWSGRTLLQTYVKPEPPRLRLDPVAEETAADRITVTGAVSDDATSLRVAGREVTPDRGAFAAEVPLAYGDNAIAVVAGDRVGHTAQAVLRVRRVAAVAGIGVVPAVAVAVGESVDLAAVALDPAGAPIPADVVSPAARVDGLGAMMGHTYVAPARPGAATIFWTAGDAAAATAVTVLPGPLHAIDVVAPDATLRVGAAMPLAARGRDRFGNPVTVTPEWSVTGPATIDAAGVLTGRAPGTVTVTAAAGGVRGTATVEVTAPPPPPRRRTPAPDPPPDPAPDPPPDPAPDPGPGDDQAPAAPVAVTIQPQQAGTDDTIAGAAGSAEVGAEVRVYAGGTLVATGTAAADGSWGPLSLGDNLHAAVTVRQADAAGNVSPDAGPFLNDIDGPLMESAAFVSAGTVRVVFSEDLTSRSFTVSFVLSNGALEWEPDLAVWSADRPRALDLYFSDLAAGAAWSLTEGGTVPDALGNTGPGGTVTVTGAP